ncbi:MAG TPA: GNAT family N-acetyltransferase [Pseudonocardia sp.]
MTGPAVVAGEHPLDNPARAALLGPHRHLAQRRGRVLRYPSEVSPFIGFPDDPGPEDWRDLALLLGPGAPVPVPGLLAQPPSDWEVLFDVAGVQMVDAGISAAADAEAVALGPADVPEMLELVARTEPGPFLPGTIRMGEYLGIRRGGALVAMAGERLHPPGWTEISAVCTDPAYRGQGLASRLVGAVATGIRRRGETPFLHAAEANVSAIRLYESLGFRLRRRTAFRAVRVPARWPLEQGAQR